MSKLFLQGEQGIGKSFMLRHALLPHAKQIIGYTTQRLYEDGKHTGFRCCVLGGDIPEQDCEYDGLSNEGVFLYRGERMPERLEEVMEKVLASCGGSHKLVLLDEIGGMELKSQPFMGALKKVLGCGLPVMGVLKALANLQSTMRFHGMDSKYVMLHADLVKTIEKDGSILTLTDENRQRVLNEVLNFIDTIFAP